MSQEKLEEFIGATNSGDNCHLVTIPAGVLPSDVLISSPIVSGEAGGGGGGGGGGSGLAAGGGGEFGGAADFGGEQREQGRRKSVICIERFREIGVGFLLLVNADIMLPQT